MLTASLPPDTDVTVMASNAAGVLCTSPTVSRPAALWRHAWAGDHLVMPVCSLMLALGWPSLPWIAPMPLSLCEYMGHRREEKVRIYLLVENRKFSVVCLSVGGGGSCTPPLHLALLPSSLFFSSSFLLRISSQRRTLTQLLSDGVPSFQTKRCIQCGSCTCCKGQ